MRSPPKNLFWIKGIVHPVINGVDEYGYKFRPNELEHAAKLLKGKPIRFEHDSSIDIGTCTNAFVDPDHGLIATCFIPLNEDDSYTRKICAGVWEGKFTGFSFGQVPIHLDTAAGPAVVGIKVKELSVVAKPGIPGSTLYRCAYTTPDGKTLAEKTLSDAILASANLENPLVENEIVTSELPPCLKDPDPDDSAHQVHASLGEKVDLVPETQPSQPAAVVTAAEQNHTPNPAITTASEMDPNAASAASAVPVPDAQAAPVAVPAIDPNVAVARTEPVAVIEETLRAQSQANQPQAVVNALLGNNAQQQQQQQPVAAASPPAAAPAAASDPPAPASAAATTTHSDLLAALQQYLPNVSDAEKVSLLRQAMENQRKAEEEKTRKSVAEEQERIAKFVKMNTDIATGDKGDHAEEIDRLLVVLEAADKRAEATKKLTLTSEEAYAQMRLLELQNEIRAQRFKEQSNNRIQEQERAIEAARVQKQKEEEQKRLAAEEKAKIDAQRKAVLSAPQAAAPAPPMIRPGPNGGTRIDVPTANLFQAQPVGASGSAPGVVTVRTVLENRKRALDTAPASASAVAAPTTQQQQPPSRPSFSTLSRAAAAASVASASVKPASAPFQQEVGASGSSSSFAQQLNQGAQRYGYAQQQESSEQEEEEQYPKQLADGSVLMGPADRNSGYQSRITPAGMNAVEQLIGASLSAGKNIPNTAAHPERTKKLARFDTEFPGIVDAVLACDTLPGGQFVHSDRCREMLRQRGEIHYRTQDGFVFKYTGSSELDPVFKSRFQPMYGDDWE